MIKNKLTYKSTTRACYVGIISQAIIVNLAPILFIPLRSIYGFSLTQLASLTLINFLVQVSVDLIFAGLADKIGFRKLTIATNIVNVVGLSVFMLAPILAPNNVFVMLVVGTCIFSFAGGLLEVIMSPIVNSIPTDDKVKAMSMLHSFYAWGQVAVVAITTILVYILGVNNWQWIVLFWIAIPIINLIQFSIVPLAPSVHESKRQGLKTIIKKPYIWILLLVIALGGATEQIMAQWSSAFLEKGMNIPKIVGDIVGVCGFALMLGIGRAIFGKFGEKINLELFMLIGMSVAFLCYITVAVSTVKAISIIACMIAGLAVSMLWPGSISLASAKFPLAGSSMFAVLSCFGDVGASGGAMTTGSVADAVMKLDFVIDLANKWGFTQDEMGLRVGMLVSAIIPMLGIIAMTVIYIKKSKKNTDNQPLTSLTE